MIILPAWPAPRDVVARVQDFGGYLDGAAGSETIRVNHLGNRYAVTMIMPKLENQKQGRIWVNRLVKGQREGVRIEYPLLDFDPGAPNRSDGSPITVDGAGQAGEFLAVMNGVPGYAYLEGQPVSLEIDGQHFFDFVAEPSIVGPDGKAVIQLSQMIRKPPLAGSILHVAKPMIEGFVRGNEVSWEIALERLIGLSFEIWESR
ncbi:hypothetical protein ACQKE8_13025 [Sphingobium limneticum]|uniref:hypothetical protein n=1 Tax=Sphingobium limneticum TaxID=1007511 RepID=UPI003CFF8A95